MTLIDTQPHAFLNDVGTVFRVTVVEKVYSAAYDCWVDQAVDISQATLKEIVFVTPAGKARPRSAAFTTDGTDGALEYTTIEGDLDQVGGASKPWRFSAYVERPGKKHQTTQKVFQVDAGVPRPNIVIEAGLCGVTLTAPISLVTIA